MKRTIINFILVLVSILTVTVGIIAAAKPSSLTFTSFGICIGCLAVSLLTIYFVKKIYKHNL